VLTFELICSSFAQPTQYTSEAQSETVTVAKSETQFVATIPAGKEQVFVQLAADADIGNAYARMWTHDAPPYSRVPHTASPTPPLKDSRCPCFGTKMTLIGVYYRMRTRFVFTPLAAFFLFLKTSSWWPRTAP
jgi:hypothetical protein